jgi:hypothetical protein
MQPEGIRSEFLRPAQEDYSRLIARLSAKFPADSGRAR